MGIVSWTSTPTSTSMHGGPVVTGYSRAELNPDEAISAWRAAAAPKGGHLGQQDIFTLPSTHRSP
jgi:hypothetical protein